MDVYRMWQTQLAGGACHFANDLTRCDMEMVYDRVDSRDVPGLVMLPNLDAAGIHQLTRIPLGRP